MNDPLGAIRSIQSTVRHRIEREGQGALLLELFTTCTLTTVSSWVLHDWILDEGTATHLSGWVGTGIGGFLWTGYAYADESLAPEEGSANHLEFPPDWLVEEAIKGQREPWPVFSSTSSTSYQPPRRRFVYKPPVDWEERLNRLGVDSHEAAKENYRPAKRKFSASSQGLDLAETSRVPMEGTSDRVSFAPSTAGIQFPALPRSRKTNNTCWLSTAAGFVKVLEHLFSQLAQERRPSISQVARPCIRAVIEKGREATREEIDAAYNVIWQFVGRAEVKELKRLLRELPKGVQQRIISIATASSPPDEAETAPAPEPFGEIISRLELWAPFRGIISKIGRGEEITREEIDTAHDAIWPHLEAVAANGGRGGLQDPSEAIIHLLDALPRRIREQINIHLRRTLVYPRERVVIARERGTPEELAALEEEYTVVEMTKQQLEGTEDLVIPYRATGDGEDLTIQLPYNCGSVERGVSTLLEGSELDRHQFIARVRRQTKGKDGEALYRYYRVAAGTPRVETEFTGYPDLLFVQIMRYSWNVETMRQEFRRDDVDIAPRLRLPGADYKLEAGTHFGGAHHTLTVKHDGEFWRMNDLTQPRRVGLNPMADMKTAYFLAYRRVERPAPAGGGATSSTS